jgi:hypothetical protein
MGGGMKVTIKGAGFVNGVTVTIGGNPVSDVTFINSATLTATVPACTTNGAVAVVVTNPPPDSQVGILPHGFICAYTINPMYLPFLQHRWAK